MDYNAAMPQSNFQLPVNQSTGTSLPKFILIFIVSASGVLLILRLVLPPQDYVKADNTVGSVMASECQQMQGKLTKLPSGRSGCEVAGALFTVSTK